MCEGESFKERERERKTEREKESSVCVRACMYMCECASMCGCVYVILYVSVRERDLRDTIEKTNCGGERENLAERESESEWRERES